MSSSSDLYVVQAYPEGQYIAMVVDEDGNVVRQATGRSEAAARRELLGLVRQEIGNVTRR